jgi:thiol:disulfide interchange protein DsbD
MISRAHPFSPLTASQRLLLRLAMPLLLALSLVVLPQLAHALSQDDLLPPDKAFAASLTREGTQLKVHFEVAPGYYLYRDRMHFSGEPGGPLAPLGMPAGKTKHDKFFGEQVIYPHSLDVSLPGPTLPAGFTLKVSYQGCAEAGVCYPPQTVHLKPGGNSKLPGWFTLAGQSGGAAGNGTNSGTPSPGAAGWLGMLGTFWLAGLGMAFTACMYPLLPILSSIIAGQGTLLTRRHGGLLALAYVQGLALTYTVVGVIAGLTGSLLTVWLQQPAVILGASALMVLMALSMFDLFNLQLPASWQSRLADRANSLPGGRWLSVFAMGALSALIVGPCIAPPLALALGYIGATGDAVRGAAALYAMALGLGTPLLLIGFFGGHLLPRAGAWMKMVKSVFGVVMLGLALWLASPFLPAMATMLLWALLGVGSAVFLRAFDGLPASAHPLQRLGKALGLLLFIAGAAELVGALTGQADPRLPLKAIANHAVTQAAAQPAFRPVASVTELDNVLAADRTRPVLLDFYADWCVSCKELESETFTDVKVAAQLGRFVLLRADVTANRPEHQALLKRFGLYGPPGVILLRSGQETGRLIGFENADAFLARLNSVGS